MRIFPALAALFIIGLLICPGPPPKNLVDSDILLSAVLKDQPKAIVQLIKRNFKPKIEGEETINGKDCWLLRLEPKRKPWPWKQVWVDKNAKSVVAMRDWSPRDELRLASKRLRLPSKDTHIKIRSTALGDVHPCLELMEITANTRYYTDGLHCVKILTRKAKSQKAETSIYRCRKGVIVVSSKGKKEVIVTGDIPEDQAKNIAMRSL